MPISTVSQARTKTDRKRNTRQEAAPQIERGTDYPPSKSRESVIIEDGSRDRALSEPAGNLDPKVSSVLLNAVFWVLRTAGVKVFFVQNVVDTGGYVEVFP
jgi:hypothetical protein